MSVSAADPPALRAVVLDMDGVVVDSEPVSLEVIAELLTDHGLAVEEDALWTLVGVPLATVIEPAQRRAPGRGGRRRRWSRSTGVGTCRGCRRAPSATPGLLGARRATSVRPGTGWRWRPRRPRPRRAWCCRRWTWPSSSTSWSPLPTWREPKPAPDLYLLATARLAVAPRRGDRRGGLQQRTGRGACGGGDLRRDSDADQPRAGPCRRRAGGVVADRAVRGPAPAGAPGGVTLVAGRPAARCPRPLVRVRA